MILELWPDGHWRCGMSRLRNILGQCFDLSILVKPISIRVHTIYFATPHVFIPYFEDMGHTMYYGLCQK